MCDDLKVCRVSVLWSKNESPRFEMAGGFLWNTSVKFLSRFAEFSKLHDLKQKFLQVNHFTLEFTDKMMFQSYLKTVQFWDEQTQNSIILRLLLKMCTFFQKNENRDILHVQS